MVKSTSHWFPLHIADYLADTQHLTLEESGAYLHLLMAYYRRGGPLPDDVKQLRAICKASPKVWSKLVPAVRPLFDVSGTGFWRHKRCDEEIEKARQVAVRQRERTRAATQNRWKTREKIASVTDTVTDTVTETQTQTQLLDLDFTSPSLFDRDLPLTNTCPKPKKTGRLARATGGEPEGSPFVCFWKEYPRKIGKRAAEKAYVAALKRADATAIMTGLALFVKHAANLEPQFIPHPATWLNQDRWLDERTETINGTHGPPLWEIEAAKARNMTIEQYRHFVRTGEIQ